MTGFSAARFGKTGGRHEFNLARALEANTPTILETAIRRVIRTTLSKNPKLTTPKHDRNLTDIERVLADFDGETKKNRNPPRVLSPFHLSPSDIYTGTKTPKI
jgi:hypothetical protein